MLPNTRATAAEFSEAAALRHAVQRLNRRLRSHAHYGLTASQVSTLTTLERHGDMRMSRLRELEQTSKSTLTRLVGRLEHEGYLKRWVDPEDARGFIVALTLEGRRTLREASNRQDLYLVRQLEALDEGDRATLHDAISAIEKLLAVRA